MSQCKKFAPNIFHKTKCSNCFRQKEEHSAEALECNRASRSIARSGYLFVAPDWDFSVPLNRNKRWQRRWFVLYDDGELNYSVDEHPDTVPQGSVDMSKVLEVTGAEQVTGHPHSLALTSPDRVTFVKAASRENARWWAELLAVFPRRHKRNATFPGGRASPSLPQLGRSASPQPPRPRHLSVNGPSPRTNFETPPLKEERETPPKEEQQQLQQPSSSSPQRPEWLPERTNSVAIESLASPIRNDYLISSGSPPTRDKLRCDDKARARRDWRNERLRDIATALTDRSPESSLALPAEGLLHLKKGWLWMKNNDNEWVRRWIVLCGPTLNVYQDQDEQGSPELVVELSTVTNYNEIPTESKYGFEIQWNCGQTLVLSAVTHGIRSNWLQALKKAAPIPIVVESSITPPTPRSILLSSDEEYRTASEGGRRGSEDWSELPPSPPLTRLSLNRTKSSRCRIGQRLSRNQSRQSTLDSTSTDELDCAKITTDCNIMENKSLIEVEELQKQLMKALNEVESLQEEIARLKKIQSDAAIREKRTNDILLNYERTEKELNQRNTQTEMKYLKEQRSLQRKLAETEQLSHTYEEKCNILTRELQTKQRLITNLQDELTNTNERLLRNRQDNDRLYKRVQELEGRYSLRQNSIRMVDSLTDLTNIDLDLDIDELGQNELKEYCLDLKCRFEKAILEIRAVKRELRDSHEINDQLELTCYSLQDNIKKIQLEHNSEMNLLIARIDHLTSKLSYSEKQLKMKLKSDSKDKRRSLSLKGQRESFSINKEVEDKVTELEAKILALERGKVRRKHKRDRSNERNSPIDDKSLRRLRRKSLDSATTSEPMKILMRLSTLESQVTNVNVSNESINLLNSSITDLTKISDGNNDLNKLITQAQLKLNDCLCCVNALKSNRTKRASSPTFDKLVSLENLLIEISDLLSGKSGICTAEADVINTSVNSVVKQLQTLLLDKLTNLSERRRLLQENNKYDTQAKLQILAEKIAYENILINRIQEALLCTPTTGNCEAICDRLLNKEKTETAHLLFSLQNKLNGTEKQQQSTFSTISCRTSADYLTKILSKCLILSAQGFKNCKNFIKKKSPSFNVLCEEQKRLTTLFNNYKAVKLPQLADALATETLYLSSDKSCRLRTLNDDIINDFNRQTHDIVNSELIQSEINHILIRAAQIYQTNLDSDHTYFFSFFASERAALELWCDQVGDCLYNEVTSSINELSEQYQNSLNKLQRQNWRRRVELERNQRSTNHLLHEYADIVAHKALIDARINVLCGKQSNIYNQQLNEQEENQENISSPVNIWLDNEQYWNLIENQSLVQINQSLEAEFVCMLDRYSGECFAILGQPELDEVMGYLDDVYKKVDELQRYANMPMKMEDDNIIVNSWNDVFKKCKCLRDNLEGIRSALNESSSTKKTESPEECHRPPIYLGTEYLTHVENLRAAYRCALASCKAAGSNSNNCHQEADIEQLRLLCERVLGSMEQWHRRTIQELREQHARELEVLKQDKEQALAEETQATLAALDAMRKAHEAEVQREVARFKQEFTRQQRDEITDLTEQLNVKCLEAAALEEQLGSATRQLAHAKQHILQLERNPQLSLMQN